MAQIIAKVGNLTGEAFARDAAGNSRRLKSGDVIREGETVAESMGSVALSYPLEYLRSTATPEPLMHAATVTGGHDQATPQQVWDPGKDQISYTQDLWPYVLLIVAGLFLLDLYAKRVRLFGYRTMKFE